MTTPLKVTPGDAKRLERNLKGKGKKKMRCEIEIDVRAVLVVVRQFDKGGAEVVIENIVVPENPGMWRDGLIRMKGRR